MDHYILVFCYLFVYLVIVKQLVREFVATSRHQMAPTTFRMDALLREMEEVDRQKVLPQKSSGKHSERKTF